MQLKILKIIYTRIPILKYIYIYKEFNSTFLTLIAEVPNSMELRDYRPISLVGVINKLILKIFANMSKMVLKHIISPF